MKICTGAKMKMPRAGEIIPQHPYGFPRMSLKRESFSKPRESFLKLKTKEPTMIKTKAEPFTLPVLPYEQNELEPYLSARMIGFHHGKHHQSYVNKLNELVSGSELAELKLEEIIVKTAGDANQRDIFNNAAQAWNHTFCWNSLSP